MPQEPGNRYLDDEAAQNLYQRRFQEKGLHIWKEFLTHSHEKFTHGGAPRVNFISDYFIRHALGHPYSSKENDYRHLVHHYQKAQEQDQQDIKPPTHKYLDYSMRQEMAEIDQIKTRAQIENICA